MTISPTALRVLMEGKPETMVVYVTVEDTTGFVFQGWIKELTYSSNIRGVHRFTCVADDGEEVWNLPVANIEHVTLKPGTHVDSMTTEEFVQQVMGGANFNGTED